MDQSKNPRINNDYESQRIFGLIQKSAVLIVVRVHVDYWTNPKSTTHSDTKASGFLDLSKKSVGLIVVHVTMDFWTNPKIRHMNNAFKMFSNLGIRTKPFPSLKMTKPAAQLGNGGFGYLCRAEISSLGPATMQTLLL